MDGHSTNFNILLSVRSLFIGLSIERSPSDTTLISVDFFYKLLFIGDRHNKRLAAIRVFKWLMSQKFQHFKSNKGNTLSKSNQINDRNLHNFEERE